MDLKSEIINLYKKTATQLPQDVVFALEQARAKESSEISANALDTILENIKLASKESKPLCQDTGMPIFYIRYPRKYSRTYLKKTIKEATNEATKIVPLRPNAVSSLTGESLGNVPVLHFKEVEKDFKIDLIMKGGGSENVSAMYQLPNKSLNAQRDLDGAKKCVIDAIFKAQGKGCPPYIVGVAMGSSIEEVAHRSKKQLLRKLDDINPIAELAKLENEVLEKINQLGIGSMGMGGSTTALAVKIFSGIRMPASFFVGISISCWCLRRQSIKIEN
jgi:fumarate hydratase class I